MGVAVSSAHIVSAASLSSGWQSYESQSAQSFASNIKRHSEGTFTSDFTRYLDKMKAKDFVHWLINTKRYSSITQFLLLAFADTRELQLLHFGLFLGIYLAALLGNGLIITAIACDHHLHTPMYFFLLNLSLLDLGSISTTLPKAMANSLWDSRVISY
ncbi:olfactory receptor 14A16-like [Grus japonensis]|uniref:Olfactory receptor 14A16-like n=1 Tax=Grus japonensis TaxID=30415 RepID=A0ABC9YBG8_GRUJA